MIDRPLRAAAGRSPCVRVALDHVEGLGAEDRLGDRRKAQAAR
jgi:hypothetical protein